jgi:hypothetical protein
MPDQPKCGLPHYDHPESTCAEPADHTGPHAAVLVIDGRECGAVAWGPDTTPGDQQ